MSPLDSTVLRPLLPHHLQELPAGQRLEVTCDGYPAQLFIDTSTGWSARLVLLFESMHSDFGERFETKYFDLEGPGRIAWGHHGASLRVLLR